MEAVTHLPTKHNLADVLFLHPDAKKSLSLAMGLVTTKATYYGITGQTECIDSRVAGVSELQSIWKLK